MKEQSLKQLPLSGHTLYTHYAFFFWFIFHFPIDSLIISVTLLMAVSIDYGSFGLVNTHLWVLSETEIHVIHSKQLTKSVSHNVLVLFENRQIIDLTMIIVGV